MRAVVIGLGLTLFTRGVAMGQAETYTTKRGYVACTDKANTVKALGLSGERSRRWTRWVPSA